MQIVLAQKTSDFYKKGKIINSIYGQEKLKKLSNLFYQKALSKMHFKIDEEYGVTFLECAVKKLKALGVI
ncbi:MULTISPECIES: hypothetical protein [Candidatus Rhabdochlamydia]|uniref:hypothetical protein n=1 Tax=Candidatus Rhabdochlamydia TaxID=292833 RepID=UPI001BFCCBC2|nr:MULTISPECIES: hypothetical protein [Rhabdochlamydia]MCL6756391.1 hypothetical protein [Candidatus Rhabdochlamydia oedothoracis]